MSVYHTSFNYLNKNSSQDFGFIISHFADGADSGETETFMSMEPIYTDNAFGTKRIDYGAKYSSVAVFRITIIKQDGSELSVNNIRNCLKWLTGSRTNSSLDLLIGHEVKYSFTGRFTNAWQYKMDAKTCGLILEFTSISPWAYSPIQTLTQSIDGATEMEIDNQSDDLYEYVCPKVVYKNTTGDSLIIENTTTGETTQVTELSKDEIITMNGNLMITSDKPSKIFGNTFNFVFPRFSAGINNLKVIGTGEITIEYIMYLKVGDCARDINVVYDPICSEDGTIQVDTLPWERISGTPTTLSGYGITDAYSKTQIEDICEVVSNKVSDERDIANVQENYPSIEYLNSYYYNCGEIDEMFVDKLDATEGSVQSMHIEKGAITGDKLAFGSVNGKKIAEGSINTTHIDTTYLDKTPKAHAGTIPHLVTSEGVYIALQEKLDKPEIDGESGQVLTLDVNGKTQWKTISSTSGGGSTYVEIDEQELNTMLAEVLGE